MVCLDVWCRCIGFALASGIAVFGYGAVAVLCLYYNGNYIQLLPVATGMQLHRCTLYTKNVIHKLNDMEYLNSES